MRKASDSDTGLRSTLAERPSVHAVSQDRMARAWIASDSVRRAHAKVWVTATSHGR